MQTPIPFRSDSSNITAVEYDPDTQSLYIQYSRGAVYRYSGVTQEMADGLSGAMSASAYLRSVISGLCEQTLIFQ